MDKVSFLTDRVVLCSQKDPSENLKASFCLCDFSVNGNGVRLDRAGIDSWLGTLVNQPLVGRIGGGDFTGHNVRIGKVMDADGTERDEVLFDTEAIGTFTDVAIVSENGTDYIVGSAEIWSRYPTVCQLIRKRASEGTLHTSWEILVSEAHMDGDVKVIDKGRFTALCVLGKTVAPAFESSRLLEVAEDYQDRELATALLHDTARKEEDPMKDETLKETAAQVNSEEAEKAEKAEDAAEAKAATESVAVEAGKEEAEKKEKDEMPEKPEKPEKEGDGSPAPDPDKEDGDRKKKEAATLLETVAQLQAALARKDAAIAEAAVKITALEEALAELQPYKEAAEQAALEKAAAERAEKRKALCAYALKSGQVTEAELAGDGEITAMLENLDEGGIKQVIADRLVASLSAEAAKDATASEGNAAMAVAAQTSAYHLDDGSNDGGTDFLTEYLNRKD